MENNFKIDYCKSKAGYSAKLDRNRNMDFNKLKKNFNVVMDAGIVLVLKIDNEEIIVHKYGELIFKTLKDKKKIEKIAEKIYGAAL